MLVQRFVFTNIVVKIVNFYEDFLDKFKCRDIVNQMLVQYLFIFFFNFIS